VSWRKGPRTETVSLAPRAPVPNHPRYPALIHRGVLDAAAGPEAYEALFAANGWIPAWRDGIFAYHHYHTRGHEALGCAAGEARLVLGGPGGPEVRIAAGDVAVLPAGTGHKRIASSRSFLVVGAYPPGQDADICREAADAAALARIAALPAPPADPTGRVSGVPAAWV